MQIKLPRGREDGRREEGREKGGRRKGGRDGMRHAAVLHSIPVEAHISRKPSP
jgi:hypothetical protein